MLDINATERALAAFPAIRHWVVGGHSLGGVAAAAYASGHHVDGLVLWASYPSNDSLKNSNTKVISIYGTQDISGLGAFDHSHDLLPPDTEYVAIQGGNHAQFGDYGVQPGDKAATITRAEQQKQAVEATVQFLKEISQ
jgi:pimeloyl-ACP methyl ester carboxylesterase